MKKARIGILGCGKQGVKHLHALTKIGGTDVFVADIDDVRAQSLAHETGTIACTPDMMLDDPSIDAVVICTPSPVHANAIVRSLATGKHVLCDKPVANTTAEVERLIEAELESPGCVAVGYLYRFVPAFSQAKLLLQESGSSSILGQPLHGLMRIGTRGDAAPWKHRHKEGGGAINEALVHMLDLARWLLGPLLDIELIDTALMCPERQIDGLCVAADAEDYVAIRCKSESGAVILIIADMVSPGFIQFLDLQGTNGSLFGSILGDLPDRIFLKEARGDYAAGATIIDAHQADLYQAQMAAFLGLIGGRDYPERHSLSDSLEVAQLIESVSETVHND